MSFDNVIGFTLPNLEDVPVREIVDAGEYELVLRRIKPTRSQKGSTAVSFVLDFVGKPSAKQMVHNVWLPNSDDSSENAMKKLQRLKEFLIAIGYTGTFKLSNDDAFEILNEALVSVSFMASIKVNEEFAKNELGFVTKVLA